MFMLLILVFQYFQEKHQQEEILRNLSQKYHIMRNDYYIKEQHLTNKSLEYDIFKNETLQQEKDLDLLFREKRRCHRKKIFSKSLQNTGMKDCMVFSLLPPSEALRSNKQTYDIC